MSSPWEELPDYEEVRSALKRQAELNAELRIAELELDILRADVSQRKPRDSTVKVVGVDDETRSRLIELQYRVENIRTKLDDVKADISFFEYRKEAARILSYKSRL